MKTAFLFSGQGSQYVGMLSDYYSSSDYAKKRINEANAILGFDLGAICFNGPEETLKETKITQPAIFLHSSIIFDLVKNKISFEAVAGHSVGEYAALYAADVFSFEDAIKLVALRGKLMFEAGLKIPGTMFAIVGLDDEKVKQVCQELSNEEAGNIIVAANFNSPGQVVVSGSAEYLRTNAIKFKEAGAKLVKELVVSGAFHSPLLNSAKEELAEAINNIQFNNSSKPVYVNITGNPLTNSSEIKESLIKQLTSPVCWTQSLNNMKNDEFSKYIELGPSNVLQGLVKRTITEVEIGGIDKFESISIIQ